MIFGRIYCVIELITDIGHLHASVQLKLKCRDLSTHIRVQQISIGNAN